MTKCMIGSVGSVEKFSFVSLILVTEHLVVLLHDIVERGYVVFHISDLSDESSEMLNPNRKQLFLSLYLNSKSTMTQFFLVLNPLWSFRFVSCDLVFLFIMKRQRES